jgi:hypothetical protein
MKITQRLGFTRFLMVLSSFSPLFILWGFRGTNTLSDLVFIPICITLVLLPNAILGIRVLLARKNNDTKSFKILEIKDQSDHVLVYLFAMLIPLYDANMGSERDFYAVCFALLLIVFLFWKLNLHYINIIFSIFGYSIFNLIVERNLNSNTIVCSSAILISKNDYLGTKQNITAFRLSDTVFLEREN